MAGRASERLRVYPLEGHGEFAFLSLDEISGKSNICHTLSYEYSEETAAMIHLLHFK